MISVAEARQRAQENLAGFPPSVVDAYLAFTEGGDFNRLDEVVLGVLEFYLAKKPGVRLTTMPGTTRLVQDLGCDSLTMADMIFLAEGLFGTKLIDEELARIVTLDDLRAHFRRQIERDKGSVAA
jgi:acyl carrier protein